MSGRLVAEAAADAGRGRPVYWLPGAAAGARVLRRPRSAGGTWCVVMGAGDVDTVGRSTGCGDSWSRFGTSHWPGLTTVGTGGSAEFFARVEESGRARRAARVGGGRGLQIGVVGSGSNLLVADEGVPGLVLKLDRELARIEPRGTAAALRGRGPAAGGGRPGGRGSGSAGIEVGVNIPGTVGGAVRMNANAYGGALGQVLAWVEVARGGGKRAAGAGAARLRLPVVEPPPRGDRRPGRVRARGGAEREEVRARLVDMRERRRHAAQPKGIRTFGSTFKNPPGETAGLLLAAAGATGSASGAPASRPSTRTSSRTPVGRPPPRSSP